jgi:hypothetical protein
MRGSSVRIPRKIRRITERAADRINQEAYFFHPGSLPSNEADRQRFKRTAYGIGYLDIILADNDTNADCGDLFMVIALYVN